MLYLLFISHFVGDFICQSRWMGRNKSSNTYALLTHTTIYSLVLMVGMGYFAYDSSHLLTFVAYNWIAHTITDFISSRCSKWAWQNEREHLFWTIIGADQLIHALTLIYLLDKLSV